MQKLPRGMFRRKGRPGFYVRLFRDGRDRWVALGSDFADARRKLVELKSGQVQLPKGRTLVREAAERWLTSYVPTQRNTQGQQLARQRFRDYLEPFLGGVLL